MQSSYFIIKEKFNCKNERKIEENANDTIWLFFSFLSSLPNWPKCEGQKCSKYFTENPK